MCETMITDLGILWEWEYDIRFVNELNQFCQQAGKSSYLVSPMNLKETIDRIRSEDLFFRVVLDRATDGDSRFIPIIQMHRQRNARIINHPEKVEQINNRVDLHLKFMQKGIKVPRSLIKNPYSEINHKDLETIGYPLVIKTATGKGGGDGVILDVKTRDELVWIQKHYQEETLLIQEHVEPKQLNNRRQWMRIFYVRGRIIPCFWDDQTHIYHRLSIEEEIQLGTCQEIVTRIHELSGIDFFSTEIVWTTHDQFVVVDYVNDQCDMRFQSDTPDGVPDAVVREITSALITSLDEDKW